MAGQDHRLFVRWWLLDASHKSHMGRQDKAHVPSQRPRLARTPAAVALHKHL